MIRDRINKPLREAGLPEIAGLERGGAADEDEKPAKPVPRRRRPR